MQVEITIKNYRCFPDSKPTKILLQKGFTSFVGVNNSGKSTLLKFFYEFRDLFQILSSPTGNLINALTGNRTDFTIGPSVLDIEEIFCNLNDRDIKIEIRDLELTQNNPLIPNRIDLTILRGTRAWLAKIYLEPIR